jgi:hypothetical protein
LAACSLSFARYKHNEKQAREFPTTPPFLSGTVRAEQYVRGQSTQTAVWLSRYVPGAQALHCDRPEVAATVPSEHVKQVVPDELGWKMTQQHSLQRKDKEKGEGEELKETWNEPAGHSEQPRAEELGWNAPERKKHSTKSIMVTARGGSPYLRRKAHSSADPATAEKNRVNLIQPTKIPKRGEHTQAGSEEAEQRHTLRAHTDTTSRV